MADMYLEFIRALSLPMDLNEVNLKGTYLELLPEDMINIINNMIRANHAENSRLHVILMEEKSWRYELSKPPRPPTIG